MKMIMIIVALLVGFKPVDQGSVVSFKIKNMGFTITGSFTGLQGDIVFDPAHPNDASFAVSIDANSIDTDNSMRDDHLRAESYFDVKNYPRITFQSTRIAKGSIVSGRLTIKNHSKDISFPFTAAPENGGYRFTGHFTINRRDFDVGGSSIISDNLEVNLSILAK